MNTGEELENGQEGVFNDEELEQLKEIFEKIWKDIKIEAKDMSKKDLALEMFLTGIMVEQQYQEDILNQQETKEENKDDKN